MPRRQLRPHQVWLIGIPLNLLLSIPFYYPVLVALLGFQVIAGELGWAELDSSLVDDGADIPIILGLMSLAFTALVVFGLNALFAFRAPTLNRAAYWVTVALLIPATVVVRLILR